MKPDGDVVLQNIKKYPHTYGSLGGSALDRMISKGDQPCCASLYRHDLSLQRAEDEARSADGRITPDVFEVREGIYQRQESTRHLWEERFRYLSDSGKELTPRQGATP